MLLLARATQFLSTRAVADDARFLLQQTARVDLPTTVAHVERGRVRAGLQAPPLGQNFKPPRRGYLGQDFRSDERQIPERVLGLQVDAAARERDRDGALRPVLDRTFALTELRAAHEYMLTDQQLGKVVLIR